MKAHGLLSYFVSLSIVCLPVFYSVRVSIPSLPHGEEAKSTYLSSIMISSVSTIIFRDILVKTKIFSFLDLFTR